MNEFDLSGLAQIAGVPLLQARNWTSGRPLHIRPSVQTAFGKGTRNLYSDSDAFKLAIANKLRDGGVAFRAIRYVVEHVDPEDFVYDGRADWLILSVTKDQISARAVPDKDFVKAMTDEFTNTKAVHHFAQLSGLLGEVLARIERYEKEPGEHDET
jgi:hypothetical protein